MEAELRRLSKRKLIQLVVQLTERLEVLEARVVELEKRNHELEDEVARLRKNSSNSSKPPSSDIVKPPAGERKPGRPRKRGIGGQKGHDRHESNLRIQDADHAVHLHADQIPNASSLDLEPAHDHAPRTLFQYELADTPVPLAVYVAHPYRDRATGAIHYAPFPDQVRVAGILGPRLTAFAACVKGGTHASYTGTTNVLRFLGADVCRATVCKKIQKVSAALGFAHGQVLDALPGQDRINIDETSHKDHPFDKPADHKTHWIWVFAAAGFTVFKIFGSRSTDALRQVLGKDCCAVIGADFYSAYRCFMKEANIKVQFCWAHLIRDIKFLGESSNKVTANYGNRLLKLCRLIFHLQHRRAQLGEEVFGRRMARLKKKFLSTGRHSHAAGTRDMVARLKGFGEEYFLFLENPKIEPTNNLAEREARHCVIDRRITQGTRGNAGQRWCERIWTVLATCARQQRDAFEFVAESVSTFYAGLPQPSLLPSD